MKASLLAVPIEIILPFVGLACIIIPIILIIKFRHKIFKTHRNVDGFYFDMEKSKEREKKAYMLGNFLQRCYADGYGSDGKRTCPVCGNSYLVAETVTDGNGDESRKYTNKKCPRCQVKFYTVSEIGRSRKYEIERNVQVDKKYKNNYELLTKYIDAYGGYEPEHDADWSDSNFIYI